jgi:hypothetical protein
MTADRTMKRTEHNHRARPLATRCPGAMSLVGTSTRTPKGPVEIYS